MSFNTFVMLVNIVGIILIYLAIKGCEIDRDKRREIEAKIELDRRRNLRLPFKTRGKE